MNYNQLFHKFIPIPIPIIIIGLLVCQCIFSYGQMSENAIKPDTLPAAKNAKAKLPKLRVGAQVGYGYRNNYITQSTFYSDGMSKPIPNSMKNHLLKLNHNISYGADFSYFILNYFGLGLRYNGINAMASSPEVLFPIEDGTFVRGSISEKVGVHYFGIYFSIRHFLPSKKHCLFANVGAGCVNYRSNLKINGKKLTLNDDSAGFAAEFGYDFFVTKHFAVGLQTSLFFGTQKYFSYIIKDGNITLGKSIRQPKRLNFNHIDISIGFRFYK